MNNSEFINIVGEAVKSLKMCDTQGFFEKVGVLRYFGQADYVNILIIRYYFSMANYRKCLENVEKIKECNNDNLKQAFTIFYWDYKIASLAAMARFTEIRDIFFEQEGLFEEDDEIVMSSYAYAFSVYLSTKHGFETDGVGIFRPESVNESPNYKDDKFQFFLFREIGKDLLEVYLQSDELLQFKSANIDRSIRKDLRAKLIEKVQMMESFCCSKYFSVPCEFQSFLKELRKKISNDRRIEKEELLALILTLFSPDMIIEDIQCWSFIMELLSTLLEGKEFVDIFQKYKEYPIESLKKKNEKIAKTILTLIQNPEIAEVRIDKSTFKEIWINQIEESLPDYIEETPLYFCDKDIYNKLSDRSKWAYKAAIWQYEQVMENGTELMDAGLLSLSFMRILEMELNIRFVHPVVEFLSDKSTDSSTKSLFANSNEYSYLTGHNRGRTLADIRYYFSGIKEHESKEAKYLYDFLCKNILNTSGIDALNEGEFEKITDQKIIDKYRNPPAHSRFLQKSVAINAKKYAEENLLKIFGWLK